MPMKTRKTQRGAIVRVLSVPKLIAHSRILPLFWLGYFVLSPRSLRFYLLLLNWWFDFCSYLVSSSRWLITAVQVISTNTFSILGFRLSLIRTKRFYFNLMNIYRKKNVFFFGRTRNERNTNYFKSHCFLLKKERKKIVKKKYR